MMPSCSPTIHRRHATGRQGCASNQCTNMVIIVRERVDTYEIKATAAFGCLSVVGSWLVVFRRAFFVVVFLQGGKR